MPRSQLPNSQNAPPTTAFPAQPGITPATAAVTTTLIVLHLLIVLAFRNPRYTVPTEALLTATLAYLTFFPSRRVRPAPHPRLQIPPWLFWAFSWGWLTQLIEPAYGFWPCTWFYMVPLLHLLASTTRLRTLFVRASLAGFFAATGLFGWLHHAISVFFDVGPAAAFLGFIIATIPIALQVGLALLLTRLCEAKLRIPTPLGLPIIYTLLEYWWPWPLPMHYHLALTRVPFLLQPADLIGGTGLTLITALTSSALFITIESAWKLQPARAGMFGLLVAGTLGMHISYSGIMWLGDGPPVSSRNRLSVTIVQPVAPLKIASRDHATRAVVAARLTDLSRKGAAGALPPPDLIIWPEGAAVVAARSPSWNPEYIQAIHDTTRETSAALLLHGIEFDPSRPAPNSRYYSVVDLINSAGNPTTTYHKALLMPLAESLPLANTFPIIRRWFPQSRSILAGTEATVIPAAKKSVVGPLICYEALSSGHARALVQRGATWLANLTNDEWYGTTQQPRQHLSFMQVRAVETRRPVARATNSGISAIISARGEIESAAPQEQATFLNGTIYPRDDKSLYVRLGPVLPQWILPLALVVRAIQQWLLHRSKQRTN